MAYTKYSLTPANNNATPPDGAPEGMLPSAVNDTMRDMMAQIRDVGDGIRNGTYTMTAPVITGGSITGVALSGNTFTNPVITGGSINNTPIGASTANTGAFTTLSASGVATFSAGTVSAPAITTTGDTNTGIFFPSADTIAFTEGGVESMRIDSSGNVGIGTSSPTDRFTVVGVGETGAPADGGSKTASIRVSATGGGGGDGGQIEFGFGFGSYSQSYFSAIKGLGSNGDGNTLGHLAFYTRNATGDTSLTERMRIDSSGNVGIGTSSPASGVLLDLKQPTAGTDLVIGLSAGTGARAQIRSVAQGSSNDSVISFQTTSGGSTNERMRITSGGRLLVGTTTENTSGGVLQVSNGITFPATQSASSDANTLDDYEEGTFTPTAEGSSTAGTTTYTTQTGSYTKIGRQVTVQIRLGWSALTGTGELQFKNLPFTPNGEYIGSCITNNLNWPAGFSSAATYVPANAPFVVIFYSRDDGTWDTQQCVNEAADIRLTMTYFVG